MTSTITTTTLNIGLDKKQFLAQLKVAKMLSSVGVLISVNGQLNLTSYMVYGSIKLNQDLDCYNLDNFSSIINIDLAIKVITTIKTKNVDIIINNDTNFATAMINGINCSLTIDSQSTLKNEHEVKLITNNYDSFISQPKIIKQVTQVHSDNLIELCNHQIISIAKEQSKQILTYCQFNLIDNKLITCYATNAHTLSEFIYNNSANNNYSSYPAILIKRELIVILSKLLKINKGIVKILDVSAEELGIFSNYNNDNYTRIGIYGGYFSLIDCGRTDSIDSYPKITQLIPNYTDNIVIKDCKQLLDSIKIFWDKKRHMSVAIDLKSNELFFTYLDKNNHKFAIDESIKITFEAKCNTEWLDGDNSIVFLKYEFLVNAINTLITKQSSDIKMSYKDYNFKGLIKLQSVDCNYKSQYVMPMQIRLH